MSKCESAAHHGPLLSVRVSGEALDAHGGEFLLVTVSGETPDAYGERVQVALVSGETPAAHRKLSPGGAAGSYGGLSSPRRG